MTDAKGRLQFRVWITGADDGAIRVEGPADSAEALEARLTRYLIADDVEVTDLTGKWSLVTFHRTGGGRSAGRDRSRKRQIWHARHRLVDSRGTRDPVSRRTFGMLEGDALEAFRIAQGVPAWGRELTEGMLPPEAGLDATDISYQKGCYIGQEVISRIKSVGRVNRRLERFSVNAAVEGGPLIDAKGQPAGELTSVSPEVAHGARLALGFVKRGVSEVFAVAPDGSRVPVTRES